MSTRQEDRRLALGAVVIAVMWAVGCGGGGVTRPTPISEEPPSVAPVMPTRYVGAFAASRDVPEAAANGGNAVLVVPTYSESAELVRNALLANGKVAIVSAHHVFGGPRDAWGVEPTIEAQSKAGPRAFAMGPRGHQVSALSVGGWQRTVAWMKPIQDAGLLAGVYVVDEPLGNGISAETRDEAISIVASAGYTTIVGEWIDRAKKADRAPSDLYGVTCYDWPGLGGWRMDRCEEAYRSHPEWDLVIGQAYDLHPRNGTPAEQLRRWVDLSQDRDGVIFWVWAWDGQTGIRDAYLAEYNAVVGR